jgi:hypothetical protein
MEDGKASTVFLVAVCLYHLDTPHEDILKEHWLQHHLDHTHCVRKCHFMHLSYALTPFASFSILKLNLMRFPLKNSQAFIGHPKK